jgi:hypothetical protein
MGGKHWPYRGIADPTAAKARCDSPPAEEGRYETPAKSPEFRKEWTRFDQVAEGIDPHQYEVVHVMDSRKA